MTHTRQWREMAQNGTKLYAVIYGGTEDWDAFIYTSKTAAEEEILRLEREDREAGIYEPYYYRVEDVTTYFTL